MGEMDASVHLLGMVPDTVPSERRRAALGGRCNKSRGREQRPR